MTKNLAYIIGGFVAGVIVILLILVLLRFAAGNRQSPNGGPGAGQGQPPARQVQVVTSYPGLREANQLQSSIPGLE
jgi:hypothetical protein